MCLLKSFSFLPTDEYSDLVLGIGAIERQLGTWASRGGDRLPTPGSCLRRSLGF
jgi:hypothetical protein